MYRFRDIATYWSKIAEKPTTLTRISAQTLKSDSWATFLPLTVWVYVHSYFRGGLRKTDV